MKIEICISRHHLLFNFTAGFRPPFMFLGHKSNQMTLVCQWIYNSVVNWTRWHLSGREAHLHKKGGFCLKIHETVGHPLKSYFYIHLFRRKTFQAKHKEYHTFRPWTECPRRDWFDFRDENSGWQRIFGLVFLKKIPNINRDLMNQLLLFLFFNCYFILHGICIKISYVNNKNSIHWNLCLKTRGRNDFPKVTEKEKGVLKRNFWEREFSLVSAVGWWIMCFSCIWLLYNCMLI